MTQNNQRDFLNILLLGEPGVGKTLAGLSFPGVEHHTFGSNEHDTAKNFPDRKDILPEIKFGWRDCLTDKERELFESPDLKKDVMTRHKERSLVSNKARARNVARYFDYLEKLYLDVKGGKRPELKTVFLDNFTPLSEDIWIYTEMLHAGDYSEKEGFKLHGDYKNYMDHLLDTLNSISANIVVSCHVTMALDEEVSSKVEFFKQGSVSSQKQWQPYLQGKYKFRVAGKFSYALFMFTEESTGKDTQYLAKIVADSQNVGVAKARLNPFEGVDDHKNGRRIVVPKGSFYQFISDAINKKGGK